MGGITVVIPCYNEADRLESENLRALVAALPLRIILVNDGSTDATEKVLRGYCDAQPQLTLLSLAKNRGKAEAVRVGMRAAIEAGAEVTGYFDADFAVPAGEVARLIRRFEAHPKEITVMLGARVKLLGVPIQRKPMRHYLGRVFASVASLTLRLPVYDTQCGAKLFRVDPTLRAALEKPFRSRWIFDVELLQRLTDLYTDAGRNPEAHFREEPLAEWRDVRGSKLTSGHMLRAGFELLGLFAASRLGRA